MSNLLKAMAHEVGIRLENATKFSDKQYGFALFLFDFENEENLVYTSNAKRESMIKFLELFLKNMRTQ